jgi:hypothetical protein
LNLDRVEALDQPGAAHLGQAGAHRAGGHRRLRPVVAGRLLIDEYQDGRVVLVQAFDARLRNGGVAGDPLCPRAGDDFLAGQRTRWRR